MKLAALVVLDVLKTAETVMRQGGCTILQKHHQFLGQYMNLLVLEL